MSGHFFENHVFILDEHGARGLFVGAARYYMRRRTATAAMFPSFIKRFLRDLSPATASIIARDIVKEMEMDARCDDVPGYVPIGESWTALLPFLKER